MAEQHQWPSDISMQAFRNTWQLEGTPVWETVFEMHRDKMQIKNINVAIANLENILLSTFKLTFEKGFQAMSLRDLSRETGISMGGLYAYIGSKNELASVIENVLRHYIDKVLGSLWQHDLDPITHLKANIFGETYMNEILYPWFYFCYMEIKGLPREQQEKAMDLELKAEEMIASTIQRGIEQGLFDCDNPRMLAASVIGQLQEWYLKRWKFKRMHIGYDQFADSVFRFLMRNLACEEAAWRSHTGIGAAPAADATLKKAI